METTYLTSINTADVQLYLYLGTSEEAAKSTRARLVEPALTYQVAVVENVEKVQQIVFNWTQLYLEELSGRDDNDKVDYDRLTKVVDLGVRAESFFGMTRQSFIELVAELFGQPTAEILAPTVPDFPTPPSPPQTLIDPDIVKIHKIEFNSNGGIARQELLDPLA